MNEVETYIQQFPENVQEILQKINIGLTLWQLAEKCGINKTYISRIENDAYNIRLSILMRIILDGLRG